MSQITFLGSNPAQIGDSGEKKKLGNWVLTYRDGNRILRDRQTTTYPIHVRS